MNIKKSQEMKAKLLLRAGLTVSGFSEKYGYPPYLVYRALDRRYNRWLARAGRVSEIIGKIEQEINRAA